MTKEQVAQKIKEIVAKDKSFDGAKVTINLVDKNAQKMHTKKRK